MTCTGCETLATRVEILTTQKAEVEQPLRAIVEALKCVGCGKLSVTATTGSYQGSCGCSYIVCGSCIAKSAQCHFCGQDPKKVEVTPLPPVMQRVMALIPRALAEPRTEPTEAVKPAPRVFRKRVPTARRHDLPLTIGNKPDLTTKEAEGPGGRVPTTIAPAPTSTTTTSSSVWGVLGAWKGIQVDGETMESNPDILDTLNPVVKEEQEAEDLPLGSLCAPDALDVPVWSNESSSPPLTPPPTEEEEKDVVTEVTPIIKSAVVDLTGPPQSVASNTTTTTTTTTTSTTSRTTAPSASAVIPISLPPAPKSGKKSSAGFHRLRLEAPGTSAARYRQVIHLLRTEFIGGWAALARVWNVTPDVLDQQVQRYLMTKPVFNREQILLSFTALDLAPVKNLSAYLNCVIRDHEAIPQICLYYLAERCPNEDHCPYVHPGASPGWYTLQVRWGISPWNLDYAVLSYLAKLDVQEQDSILMWLADRDLHQVHNLSAYLSKAILQSRK